MGGGFGARSGFEDWDGGVLIAFAEAGHGGGGVQMIYAQANGR